MTRSTTSNPKAAFVYLRTASIDHIDREYALDRQWEVCRAYARHRGLTITDTYFDAGASGLSPRRPDLDRMLRALSLGQARFLITADQARLARDLRLRLALELEIARYGVELLIPTSVTAHQAVTERKKENCHQPH
jgi:DNA invertase Pin-like site-specific DNA recombinase